MTPISLVSTDWVWYKAGKGGVSAAVGYEDSSRRVGRYQFTAPSTGATSVSLTLYSAGKGSGSHIPINWYIGTDPDSHANAGPDAEALGTLTLGDDWLTFTGSADLLLMPGQTYYLWIFPGEDTFGWYWATRSGYTSVLQPSGVAGYSLPTVVISSAYRCDAEGNEDQSGAYAMIIFSATVTSLDGTNSAAYKLLYRVRGASAWTEVELTELAGNYAPTNASRILPADTGKGYEYCVEVTDDYGSVMSAYRTIQWTFAAFDYDRATRALGFGRKATAAGKAAFGLPVILDGGMDATGSYYYGHEDEDETALNDWLDGQLGTMPNGSIKPVYIHCYPAVHGTYLLGFLMRSTANYAMVVLFAYGKYFFHKAKLDGVWEDTTTHSLT